MRHAVEGWLRWLRDDAHLRPTTRKCWRSALVCLLNLLPEHPTAEEFARALDQRMPSNRKAVRSKTWDALTSFYAWWEPRGGPASPLRHMRRPRQSRARRPSLTDAQLEELLWVVKTAAPKVRAEIYIMLITGARPSDVVNLWVEDVDFTPGRERIRFRDRKSDASDEWHPMSPVVADVIRLYLASVDVPGGYLFPGHRGRMTTQAIDNAWRALGLGRLGMMPSQSRKWFANRLRRDGVDFEIIRQRLGHSDVSTTQVYLRPEIDEGRNAVLDVGAFIRRHERSATMPVR